MSTARASTAVTYVLPTFSQKQPRDLSPKTVSKFIFFNLFAAFFNLFVSFLNLFAAFFSLFGSFFNLLEVFLNLSAAFINLFVVLFSVFVAKKGDLCESPFGLPGGTAS